VSVIRWVMNARWLSHSLAFMGQAGPLFAGSASTLPSGFTNVTGAGSVSFATHL